MEVLKIPEECATNPQVFDYEPNVVAQVIHNAVAPKSKTTPPAKPGDFMIIAARKKNLSRYAQRLSELGIPSQVTGGAVLSEIRQLSLLCQCLEAITQPDNPVALVAVLRSELFGISDRVLYAFKKAGGRFSFQAKVPDEVAEPFSDAFSRLRRYDLWLKEFPPVAAVETDRGGLGAYCQRRRRTRRKYPRWRSGAGDRTAEGCPIDRKFHLRTGGLPSPGCRWRGNT